MISELNVIHLEGNNYEMGYQHGKVLAKQIEQVIQMRYQNIKNNFDISFDEVLKESEKYIYYIEKYFPDYIEELEGMAKGSEQSFEKIFFIQVASEFIHKPAESCSAFGVASKYTKGKNTIIGQNWDTSANSHANSQGLQVILHLKPLGKPEMLMFAVPGVIGYMGLNELGHAHVANTLKSSGWHYGVPQYFLHRKFLETKSIDECVHIAKELPLSSSANYLVTDGEGAIKDIEITPMGIRTIQSEKFLVHTNHFIHKDLQKYERYYEGLDNSIIRYRRLNLLIKNNLPIDVGKMKSFLSDHDNYPNCICGHMPPHITMASLIIESQVGKFFVAPGTPCNTEFKFFYLNDL